MHLYAKSIVLDAIRELGGSSYVLGATDAGRAKWVESLANELNVSAGFVFKRRLDGAHTEVVAMNANIRDRGVVIYDDMIRTGSSLIQAAESFRAAGATRRWWSPRTESSPREPSSESNRAAPSNESFAQLPPPRSRGGVGVRQREEHGRHLRRLPDLVTRAVSEAREVRLRPQRSTRTGLPLPE